MMTGELQLYDIEQDIGEARDVAAQHPEVAAQIAAIMTAAHTPSPNWKVR